MLKRNASLGGGPGGGPGGIRPGGMDVGGPGGIIDGGNLKYFVIYHLGHVSTMVQLPLG